jgi:hypothetical protein
MTSSMLQRDPSNHLHGRRHTQRPVNADEIVVHAVERQPEQRICENRRNLWIHSSAIVVTRWQVAR